MSFFEITYSNFMGYEHYFSEFADPRSGPLMSAMFAGVCHCQVFYYYLQTGSKPLSLKFHIIVV